MIKAGNDMSFPKFIRSHIIFVLLLLVPLLLHHRLYSGDEPHYFVIASSIVKDFDLDIKNNYRNAQLGGNDAGLNFRSKKIDHHSFYYDPVSRKRIPWMLNLNKKSWTPPANTENLLRMKEYSQHSIGLPVLVSPVYFLFKRCDFVEVFVLFVSFLVSLAGMFFCYRIISRILEANDVELFLFIFMFGTPIWHYSRTFFPEVYTWPLLAAAIYYLCFRQRSFTAGFLMGIALLVKYTMVLISLVFLIYLILSKERKSLIRYLFGFLPFLLILFGLCLSPVWYNQDLIGFFRQDLIGRLSRIIPTFIYIFLQPNHGIFVFSPFLALSFLGFRFIYEENRRLFAVVLLLTGSYLISSGIVLSKFVFSLRDLGGGYCYAYRYFIVLLPVLMVPTAYWYRENKRNKGIISCFYALVLISIIINLFSVIMPPREVWGVPVCKLLALY